MSLPDLTHLPPDSSTPVDTDARRFEELAILQRLLAAEQARSAEFEAQLDARKQAYGDPDGDMHTREKIIALEEDLDRLGEAVIEKERARFELEQDLIALTEDHDRISYAMAQSGSEDGSTRSDLVLEIRKLKQELAAERAALQQARDRLSRSRLSEPFSEHGERIDDATLTARSERGMRRSQMQMMTKLMAAWGRSDG